MAHDMSIEDALKVAERPLVEAFEKLVEALEVLADEVKTFHDREPKPQAALDNMSPTNPDLDQFRTGDGGTLAKHVVVDADRVVAAVAHVAHGRDRGMADSEAAELLHFRAREPHVHTLIGVSAECLSKFKTLSRYVIEGLLERFEDAIDKVRDFKIVGE